MANILQTDRQTDTFFPFRPDPGRIACLLHESEGLYHRHHSSAKVQFPYSQAQFEAGLASICRLQRVLGGGGDSPLPLQRYWTSVGQRFDMTQLANYPPDVIKC